MPLTVDEKEIGGLEGVRTLVEIGASPARLKEYLDSIDAPEVEALDTDATNAPVEIASERRRLGVQILRDVPQSVLNAGRRAGMRSQGYPGYLVAEAFPKPSDYYTEVLQEPAVIEPIRMEDATPGVYERSADEIQAERRQGRVIVYGDEGTMARLIAQEKADPPAPRRQAVKVEQVHMIAEGLPLPGESLSAEDFASAQLVQQALKPLEFSGEYAVGGIAPIPK